MKNTLLVLLFLLFIMSCKKQEGAIENIEIEEVPTANHPEEDTTAYVFEDFKCKPSISETKSKIDFSSSKTGRSFKTAISNEYESEAINFGAYYIVSTWGCGTGCISGVIVDTRDGKIYDLPSNEFWEGIGNSVDHKADSYLLITSAVQLVQDEKGNLIDLHHYWKWNEQQKQFEDLSM